MPLQASDDTELGSYYVGGNVQHYHRLGRNSSSMWSSSGDPSYVALSATNYIAWQYAQNPTVSSYCVVVKRNNSFNQANSNPTNNEGTFFRPKGIAVNYFIKVNNSREFIDV